MIDIHLVIERRQFNNSTIRDEVKVNNLLLLEYKNIIESKLDIEFEYASDLRDYELEEAAELIAYYMIENDKNREDIKSIQIYRNDKYVKEVTLEDWENNRGYIL